MKLRARVRAPATLVEAELVMVDGEVEVRRLVRLRTSSSSTKRN